MTSCHSGTFSLFSGLPPLCWSSPFRVSSRQPTPDCSLRSDACTWASAPRPHHHSRWKLVIHFLAEKWYLAVISVVNFLYFSLWAPTFALLSKVLNPTLAPPVRGCPSVQKLSLLHDFLPFGTSPHPEILYLFLSFYLLPYLILRRLVYPFWSLGSSGSIQKVFYRSSCSTCRLIFLCISGEESDLPILFLQHLPSCTTLSLSIHSLMDT